MSTAKNRSGVAKPETLRIDMILVAVSAALGLVGSFTGWFRHIPLTSKWVIWLIALGMLTGACVVGVTKYKLKPSGRAIVMICLFLALAAMPQTVRNWALAKVGAAPVVKVTLSPVTRYYDPDGPVAMSYEWHETPEGAVVATRWPYRDQVINGQKIQGFWKFGNDQLRFEYPVLSYKIASADDYVQQAEVLLIHVHESRPIYDSIPVISFSPSILHKFRIENEGNGGIFDTRVSFQIVAGAKRFGPFKAHPGSLFRDTVSVDVGPYLKSVGVDVGFLEHHERSDMMDNAGLAVGLRALGPLRGSAGPVWAPVVVGTIEYETDVRGTWKSLPFEVPICLVQPGPMGPPESLAREGNVVLHAWGKNYDTSPVMVNTVLKPDDPTTIELRVACRSSARHRFTPELIMTDGSRMMLPTVDLTMIIPKSQQVNFTDSILFSD